ncbi:MAG TPA: AAA family ATPase [Pseudolabrys sp.]
MNFPLSLGAGGTGRLVVLCEDGERVLCRGWRDDSDGDRKAILAALSGSEHPTPAFNDRLAHEYALKDELDGRSAVRPLALMREHGQTMLLFEDPGGEPLDRLLGRPMEMDRFLHIAIGLTLALGQVHERGLIHKDLKPANVMVNAATDQVWLMGFGIASRLPRERQAPEPPETIAGTLAYMAPEQTGRMNRSIDSRSDLYALGVILYEMLTGSLPFTAADPMDWVHCHIARKPRPPVERLAHIPASVSATIMKLLAKTAEERYQTTGGLERDLRRCLNDWESRGCIEDFPLGQEDTPDRLLIPEKLYGRKREVETLLASFDRIAKSGPPELVLVSGYSGIGKSSVVNELHKVLVPPRGLFASGKFDQYKRDIPYSTLVQAFQGLIRPLLAKSDAELSGWRDALLEALGANGRLMVDLVPELKLIIGEQPPVPELEPQQAQSRFQLVLRRFIDVFARPEHPLALFLDDLQWLDAATLDLLEDLLTRSDLQSLMLVGAYRDNEVTASHPLMRKLDAAKAAGGKIVEIRIAPLAQEHLRQLIGDALHCEPMRAAPLAQLVHEKTAGNPFFVIQFLSALAEEGLLTFHPESAQWSWDLDRAYAKGYTENIADLMSAKLTRLPADTQAALQMLACLGNTAQIATVSLVLDAPEQVEASLLEAVRQELIQRLETSYRFTHDRVQEVAYALIPEQERAAVHLQIGKRLLERTQPEDLDEKLFEIVNHLNSGIELITDPAERARLADLNAAAGRRARASIAYSTARNFFAAGAAILPEETWDSRYDFKFGLFLDWAESEYLRGNFEEAETLFEVLLARAKSDLDQAAVYELRLKMYQIASKYDDALLMAVKALQLFGLEIPSDDGTLRKETQEEAAAVKVNLGGRDIADLANAQEATDPRIKAMITLLANAIPVAYLGNTPQYFPLITLKLVNFSLKFGHTKETCVGYTSYAIMLVSLYDDPYSADAFAKMAIELNYKLGDITRRGTILHHYGDHINFWLHPVSTGFPILDKAFLACMDAGDFVFAGHIAFEVIWQAVERGDRLEDVLTFSERFADFARGSRNDAVYQTICLEQQFARCLMGKTAGASSFSDETLNEMQCIDKIVGAAFITGQNFYHTMKLFAAYLMGDDADWRDHAEKAKTALPGAMSMPMEATFYFVHAVVLTRAYRNTADASRNEILNTLTAYEKKLRFWANNCPENFGSKHALVAAEIAEIRGDKRSAERLFEKAIESARRNGFIHWEGMANEAAARFYAARGLQAVSLALLRNAHRCYVRWGATAKARQLDRLHPQLRDDPVVGPTSTIGTPVAELDLATVIRVSQAVSSEIVLDKLIDTLMRTAVAQAGAERALLMLVRGAEQRIAAEATTSGDTVAVYVRDEPVSESTLPASVLQYVVRTRDAVIVDNAAEQSPFEDDRYIRQRQARSILCLPLLNQAKLLGVLYLENNLAPRVFAPARTAVLKLLASQAAISLENSRLYRDLAEREAKIRRLVDANIIGVFMWDLEGRILEANDAFLRMVGYDRDDLVAGRLDWSSLTPPEWRGRTARALAEKEETGTIQPYEKEYCRKDGSLVPVLIGSASFDESGQQGVAFVLDLTERKRAEAEACESERRYRETQMELAHVNRVTTMGQLTASIAHEVNQPIGATVTNAGAGLRWLAAQPPNLSKVRDTFESIIKAGNQASDVIGRIRGLIKKVPAQRATLDINEMILETIALTRSEMQRHCILLQTELAQDLPCILGDRVQLQQVILNLIMNAIEAMSEVGDNTRELVVGSNADAPDGVIVTVRDSGPGLKPESIDHLFDPFYTTKPTGMGMGLSICRSITEAHGGRLWASANVPQGAVFQFTLHQGDAS